LFPWSQGHARGLQVDLFVSLVAPRARPARCLKQPAARLPGNGNRSRFLWAWLSLALSFPTRWFPSPPGLRPCSLRSANLRRLPRPLAAPGVPRLPGPHRRARPWWRQGRSGRARRMADACRERLHVDGDAAVGEHGAGVAAVRDDDVTGPTTAVEPQPTVSPALFLFTSLSTTTTSPSMRAKQASMASLQRTPSSWPSPPFPSCRCRRATSAASTTCSHSRHASATRDPPCPSCSGSHANQLLDVMSMRSSGGKSTTY
jgi:hypothetical protein